MRVRAPHAWWVVSGHFSYFLVHVDEIFSGSESSSREIRNFIKESIGPSSIHLLIL